MLALLRRALAPIACVIAASSSAHAAGPLGAQGAPITTSNYTVDLFQGPILASERITGIGGAYAPVGEGVDGNNPASPALRDPYSRTRIDYDVTGSVILPSLVNPTDFDNNGTRGFTYNNFIFITAGAQLQIDRAAGALWVDMQQYALGKSDGATPITNLRVRLAKFNSLWAYSFFDDQLFLGFGLRAVVLGLVDGGAGGTSEKGLIDMFGIAPQAGAIVAPADLPLRIGGTVRAAVSSGVGTRAGVDVDNNGDLRVGAMYIPNHVELPWEAELGVAVQLGPRPLNYRWSDRRSLSDAEIDAERQVYPNGDYESAASTAKRILRRKYLALPRQKVLVAASLLVTGPTQNAVGFESFLSQTIDRSGRRPSFTPRFGVESEVVPSWVVLRGGAYLEPTRFDEAAPRGHFTTSIDVKTLPWNLFGLLDKGSWFRLGGGIDVARQYFGWGLSAGVWH